MTLKALPLLLILLTGCSSSLGPEMTVYDRQQISALIDMIEATDPVWSGYAEKGRSMHAAGHIVIADIPGDYQGWAMYWPGGSVPSLEWIYMDREFMSGDDDYCYLAAALVHELTHVIYRTGDEATCIAKAAEFDARCLDVWEVFVCGTGELDLDELRE